MFPDSGNLIMNLADPRVVFATCADYFLDDFAHSTFEFRQSGCAFGAGKYACSQCHFASGSAAWYSCRLLSKPVKDFGLQHSVCPLAILTGLA